MEPIILCDIDGTIALRGDRSPHDHDQCMEDHVNWPIVRLIDNLVDYGYLMGEIILISGRKEKYRSITEYWLRTHNIFDGYYNALLMRSTNDNRPDEVVKEELYKQYIMDKYNVLYVFDDRNSVVAMWRRLGLTCLQVADGDF